MGHTMVNNPLNVPQREVAGRTTIGKFDYQFHWALLKALHYYKEGTEFILCVEYHDDVLFIIRDNSDVPLDHENDAIELVQVKAVKGGFTRVAITKTTEKSPNSIIGKMILGASGKEFETKVKSLGLVSSAGFSELKHKDNNEYETVYLSDLPKEALEFIKNKIDEEFIELEESKRIDFLDKIILINTSLKEDSMRSHLIGAISETLEAKFKGDYYRNLDIYITIMDEIRKKCLITYSYQDWYDFRDIKGLTNNDIDIVRNTHRSNTVIFEKSQLLPNLNYPTLIEVKISKGFVNHHNLLRDKSKNTSEYKLYLDIQEMLSSNMDLLVDDLDSGDIDTLKSKLKEETLHLITDNTHAYAAIIYGIENII